MDNFLSIHIIQPENLITAEFFFASCYDFYEVEDLMKKIPLIKQIILFLSVMAVFIVPVYANSAQTFWNGTTSSGSHTQDGECPITVIHETLTYDLGVQPVPGKIDPEHYENSFRAEYTFHNPSDLEVNVLLSFPLGTSPDYMNMAETGDESQYEILVSGKAAPAVIRYTWKPRGNAFSLENDLARLKNEYRSDSFFRPDLTVTEYQYRFHSFSKQFDENANLTVNAVFPDNPAETKIFPLNASGWSTGDGESAQVFERIHEESVMTLYCIGKKQEPEFRFYEQTKDRQEDFEAETELLAVNEMTYEEFIQKLEEKPAGMSDLDFYNAMTDMFRYYSADSSILEMYGLSGNVMKWLQYELVFEPGETLVNSVKAPAYPSVDMKFDPPMFGYDYLLSPASSWKEFGTLDIIINTDLFMTKDSFGTFEKTDTGYQAHFESLPDKELSFSLNASENPKRDINNSYFIITALLIIIPLAGIILLILIVLGIVKLLRRKKKKDEI